MKVSLCFDPSQSASWQRLDAARSHSGKNNTLCCFLRPSYRFATPRASLLVSECPRTQASHSRRGGCHKADREGILFQTNFNSQLSFFHIKTATRPTCTVGDGAYDVPQIRTNSVGVDVRSDPPLPTQTNFVFSGRIISSPTATQNQSKF